VCNHDGNKLATAVFDALCRGAIDKHTDNSIEPFAPEGSDKHVDIEWLDPDSRMSRPARLTISLED
jgi:hypothetical protein